MTPTVSVFVGVRKAPGRLYLVIQEDREKEEHSQEAGDSDHKTEDVCHCFHHHDLAKVSSNLVLCKTAVLTKVFRTEAPERSR